MTHLKRPIVQYAYVVNDLDVAIMRWVELFGAGPFFKIPHFHGLNHVYRGRRAEDDVSHAQGQAGPAQIQLTQQHNDAPSIWRDMYPAGKEGLHHVMIAVDAFEEEKARFVRRGWDVAEEFSYNVDMNGETVVGHIAYLDGRHELGCFVEVCENTAAIRHELLELKALHDQWDGRDPIRMAI